MNTLSRQVFLPVVSSVSHNAILSVETALFVIDCERFPMRFDSQRSFRSLFLIFMQYDASSSVIAIRKFTLSVQIARFASCESALHASISEPSMAFSSATHSSCIATVLLHTDRIFLS